MPENAIFSGKIAADARSTRDLGLRYLAGSIGVVSGALPQWEDQVKESSDQQVPPTILRAADQKQVWIAGKIISATRKLANYPKE